MKKINVPIRRIGKEESERIERAFRRKKEREKKQPLHLLIVFLLLALLSFIIFKSLWEQAAPITNAYIEEKAPLNTKKERVSLEEKAFYFLIQFEGYHNKPYFDHKQWSCGYWMKCQSSTSWITREKSKKFVIERIKHIEKQYNLASLNNEGLQIALISFIYNIWHAPSGYKWYVKNGYINALKNRMKQYVWASWKPLRWLIKRRQAETNLF